MDFFDRIKKKKVDDQKKDFIEFLNRRNDYVNTFGTESGMRVLLDQCKTAHIFESLFTGNSETYLLEGERKRVLDIMMHTPLIAGTVIFNYCKQLEDNIDKMAHEMTKDLEKKE